MSYRGNISGDLVIRPPQRPLVLATLNGYRFGVCEYDTPQATVSAAFDAMFGTDENNAYTDRFTSEDRIDIDYDDVRLTGTDEGLWKLLAPFIELGTIYYSGEDDESWRYVFADGMVRRQHEDKRWVDD